MADKSINQVRQILMNELGLSRASVQAEANQIIREAVHKEVCRMVNEGGLETIVHNAFNYAIKERRWDGDAIKKLCIAAADKEAKRFVEEFIQTNLSFKEPTLKDEGKGTP